ncbi:MAG: hypothetical protein RLZZ399_2479 [Verrucomicrobiota bacterium]
MTKFGSPAVDFLIHPQARLWCSVVMPVRSCSITSESFGLLIVFSASTRKGAQRPRTFSSLPQEAMCCLSSPADDFLKILLHRSVDVETGPSI